MLVFGALFFIAASGAHAACDPWHPPAARGQANPNAGLTREESGGPGCAV